MRTSLIVALGLPVVVACAGPAPVPNLIRVNETGPPEEHFVTYADLATIKRSKNIVSMSSVIDSAMPDDVAGNQHRASWKDEWEYDCDDKKTRPRQYTKYSGRMGTGQTTFSQKIYPGLWLSLSPGSVGEQLWQIACGQE